MQTVSTISFFVLYGLVWVNPLSLEISLVRTCSFQISSTLVPPAAEASSQAGSFHVVVDGLERGWGPLRGQRWPSEETVEVRTAQSSNTHQGVHLSSHKSLLVGV